MDLMGARTQNVFTLKKKAIQNKNLGPVQNEEMENIRMKKNKGKEGKSSGKTKERKSAEKKQEGTFGTCGFSTSQLQKCMIDKMHLTHNDVWNIGICNTRICFYSYFKWVGHAIHEL